MDSPDKCNRTLQELGAVILVFSLVLDPSTNAPLAIILNPWAVLNKLKAHFKKFVSDLRNPAKQSLRDTFALYFDGTRTTGPKIHVTMFGTGAKSTP